MIDAQRISRFTSGTLSTTIQPSLATLPDDCLQQLTSECGFFASLPWFRALERLDLSTSIGRDSRLQFAIVSSDDRPVAVCPLIRARGRDGDVGYSFRRCYFEDWMDMALQAAPGHAANLERGFRWIRRYLRMLEWTNCSLDDYLVACSPLSPKMQLPIAPMPLDERDRVIDHLIEALQQYAQRQGRPLWFQGLEHQSPLAHRLNATDFQRIFFVYDTKIDLSEFETVDDYLSSFGSKSRRKSLRREVRQIAASDIEFRFVDDFTAYADEFSNLHHQTNVKYARSAAPSPPDTWANIGKALGCSTEAMLAEHQGRLIGFSLLLKDESRREMVNYEGGRVYDGTLEDVPYYFELLCYGPIRRCLELGYNTLWTGPLAYGPKVGRGAEQIPLDNYFWFPQRRDRWLVQRYLDEFGRRSQKTLTIAAN